MAGTSLLALIDDIATILDDVAVMTKVAAKKTAGIVGDDLAVNANQVTGVDADRELPVVWAVAKGSAINKVILVPAALLISAVAPWAIPPLLIIGGAFLCFEGVEKVLHHFLHPEEEEEHHEELVEALIDESVDMVEFEKEKIKGAIRTDFILSAEIVVIALGSIPTDATFMSRVGVLTTVAVAMTVGVYGLVAGIVKLDDLGLHLSGKGGTAAKIGDAILVAAPWFMRLLGIAGTIAMFLVGGDIILHNIPGVADFLHHALPHGGAVGSIVGMLVSAIAGILTGLLVVGVVEGIKRVRGTGGEATH